MVFSDLLMITIPIPKSIFGNYTGEQQQYKFRYVRMIDLLELDIVDATDTTNLSRLTMMLHCLHFNGRVIL
jgi:ABC-type transport system involved in Fe-S cluster assembly fused permease/ATPase subunit